MGEAGPALSLRLPVGPELFIVALAFLGGVGFFLLRVRSGGSVGERLYRIERKIGRLEAQMEDLQDRRE